MSAKTTPNEPAASLPMPARTSLRDTGDPEDNRFLRVAAVGLLSGQLLLLAASAMHPASEHPADHRAVFVEYAQDPLWTTTHLLQWAGGMLMFAALALIARYAIRSLRSRSLTGTLAGYTALAASITVAVLFTALQAIDGVALKMAVDAWVAADPERSIATFSAAEAIRWSEIGLNALARTVQATAIGTVAIAAMAAGLHGRWLAGLGVAAALAGAVGALTTAYTGFSTVAAGPGMVAMALSLAWLIATAVALLRRSSAASNTASNAMPAV